MKTGNIRFSGCLIGVVVALYSGTAVADPNPLSGLADLFAAIGWFAFIVCGIVTVYLLIIARAEKRRLSGGYSAHVVAVGGFAFLSSSWYLEPELNVSTVMVLISSASLVVLLVYHEFSKRLAHCLAGLFVLVAVALLLSNPVILRWNHYVLSGELPFYGSVTLSAVTDTRYAGFDRQFVQTCDGRLFFREGGRSGSRTKRQQASQPGILLTSAENCRAPCYNFYAIEESVNPVRPAAFIDFHRGDNGLAVSRRRTALVNIPLRTTYIYRFSERWLGKFSLVREPGGPYLWNPASSWLWKLLCSYYRGEPDLIERLLAAGADPNFQPKKEQLTTFYCTINSGNAELIEKLWRSGADPNRLFKSTIYTNLYFANSLTLVLEKYQALDVKAERLRQLIDLGADINARNPGGGTLLHHVMNMSKYGVQSKAELVQLLLDLGARDDIEDSEGLTALDVALGQRDRYQKKLLEESHMSEAFKRDWTRYVKEYKAMAEVLSR